MKGMRKTMMAAAAACTLIFSVICAAPAQSKKTLQVESGLVDAVALFAKKNDGSIGRTIVSQIIQVYGGQLFLYITLIAG